MSFPLAADEDVEVGINYVKQQSQAIEGLEQNMSLLMNWKSEQQRKLKNCNKPVLSALLFAA